jgi:glycosyltransferase involved in cell wall biosynthesis
MPKVSVIIPTYNSSRTIGETLQSVFRQTYSNFEILLINDGSTDNLMEVLKGFQDSRLKILSYENGGPSVARNRGIDRASGTYLIFLDADDLWTSDKLETHVNALDEARKMNSRAGIVYSWSYFLNDETQSCFVNQPKPYEGDVLAKILESNFLTNGSNPMITREAIDSVGYFNPDFNKGAEDWEYWIRLARQWDYLLVPRRQIFYRQSRNSQSSNIDNMENGQLQVLKSAFPTLPNHLQSIQAIARSNIYFYSAHLYFTRFPGRTRHYKIPQKLLQSLLSDPRICITLEYQKFVLRWLFQFFLKNYRSGNLLGSTEQDQKRSLTHLMY